MKAKKVSNRNLVENSKKINVTFVIKNFPSLVRFRKHVIIFHKNFEIIKTADEIIKAAADKLNYLANIKYRYDLSYIHFYYLRAFYCIGLYIEGKYREGNHLRALNYREIFSEGSKKYTQKLLNIRS